jgi:hypothetical protein
VTARLASQPGICNRLTDRNEKCRVPETRSIVANVQLLCNDESRPACTVNSSPRSKSANESLKTSYTGASSGLATCSVRLCRILSVTVGVGSPENISNGVARGTAALAPGDLVRLHGILGCLVVSKFFRPHIVFTDVQGTEQVCHRRNHSRRPRYIEDRTVDPA